MTEILEAHELTAKEAGSSKLWGGRFSIELAALAHRFSSSIKTDFRLFREDIAGSIAHVQMLGKCGIIETGEAELIADALHSILGDLELGILRFSDEEEDIHLAIERELGHRIGAVAGKLHTARSRNDQVALDERLYLKRVIPALNESIRRLQQALLTHAENHPVALMPGYTHLQRAQPILLAHHLIAYVSMLERDRSRFADCLARLDYSPLGAAAFAGTPHPIDRGMVAEALSFTGIVENSIDAVSDRDHLIETVAIVSILMMHLSRLAEELVIWSTKEFGFVELSDAVTTGSSIMPQKKNPDMAELVRGKTGRVYGALMNLLTIMKALPLSYNRDMQEDKEPLFDSIDTVADSLAVMTLVLNNTHFNIERLESETRGDLMTATEIADYLVRKGLPFREAHGVAGRIVARSIECGAHPQSFMLHELTSFSPLIEEDIYQHLDASESVLRKESLGSTSPAEVKRQLEMWRRVFDQESQD